VEPTKWQTWVQEALEVGLRNRWEQYADTDKNGKIEVDWESLKSYLEKELHGLLRRELQSRASLLFLMQHPQDTTTKTVLSERRPARNATRVAS
jgi:ribonuclease J